MANYLIDLMTWSHSRINAYLQCPYQFYQRYIAQIDEAPMFFSEYGSLIHSILAKYCSNAITREEALNEFLIRFPVEAIGERPSQSIIATYFQQGMACMKALSPIDGEILGVEKNVNFDISGLPFTGFVDLVYTDSDGCLCIMDHKSRALKQRTQRKKPTKSDIELDEYLRQLYLYSIPIERKYGRYPDFLVFNCYRSGEVIKERFHIEALEETKRWATETIDRIRSESKWRPDLEFWKCKYLCGFCHECEYAQMATF